ncbi:hypothetical protein PTSG_04676 [Salpingoeca rosetta]|uniref:Uncharacterized protein n=1 Tax=Salpingoeca rosetta (strain ATCC 50818 / BSB-021) TaxID=946362 RepID=F2U839_SALR5|nr:uncharacterized protein PTSG_04676 [Salpingoeca rosetta]EGD72944.1 hypothetical protein PTSG_04676 [Salpingoeca rosetta]|eukprot:XP_004994766.1 hypothetical protein PTSG_04676 [Salpingoeca rosetta]
MSDKSYKWQVKPGGTIPADALDVKHATSQTGSTSQRQSLQINKGGEGAPKLDSQSQGIAHAVGAPKPPQYVNAVAKDQAVRHNASGY